MSSTTKNPRLSPVRLTVAVPTFNRAPLLRQALESILAQHGADFRVVVFDNASTDETESVVASFSDPRLSWNGSALNVGLVRNWNRCIRFNTSEFLCVFNDDDLMFEGFLAESMDLLQTDPQAGFSYTQSKIIDARGSVLHSQGGWKDMPQGIMAGEDFLERIVSGRRGSVLYPSTVVYRASALADAGGFDSPHSRDIIDAHLWYLLAGRFRVGYINRELVGVREHTGQVSQGLFRTAHDIGHIGWMAERLDVIAYLLQSPRAGAAAYRRWLAERLLVLHRNETEAIHDYIPGLFWNWQEQVEAAKEEMACAIPAGAAFVLADRDEWGLGNEFEGRRVSPFSERDGVYWGPPVDGTAVSELERLKTGGAEFAVFTWTTFDWLDHYAELNPYLQRCSRVLSSSRLLIYRL